MGKSSVTEKCLVIARESGRQSGSVNGPWFKLRCFSPNILIRMLMCFCSNDKFPLSILSSYVILPQWGCNKERIVLWNKEPKII